MFDITLGILNFVKFKLNFNFRCDYSNFEQLESPLSIFDATFKVLKAEKF